MIIKKYSRASKSSQQAKIVESASSSSSSSSTSTLEINRKLWGNQDDGGNIDGPIHSAGSIYAHKMGYDEEGDPTGSMEPRPDDEGGNVYADNLMEAPTLKATERIFLPYPTVKDQPKDLAPLIKEIIDKVLALGQNPGSGEGSSGNNDVDNIKHWAGLVEADPRQWYGGYSLYTILLNIRSLLGATDWNATLFEDVNIRSWLNALRFWVGEPSLDPGDWNGDTLYEQMRRIVIPIDAVGYGNLTDYGTSSASVDNNRYQVFLNISDNRIYLYDAALGRYYSKWEGYERWKPSDGEYYRDALYVCFYGSQIIAYDKAYGGLRIIAGSMFMKGLAHESPSHTRLDQLGIPYMDEEAQSADAKVMSLEELKGLISDDDKYYDASAPYYLRIGYNEIDQLNGKIIRNPTNGQIIGNVKVFQSNNDKVVVLETILVIGQSGGVWFTAGAGTLNTYAYRVNDSNVSSNWELIRQDVLPKIGEAGG